MNFEFIFYFSESNNNESVQSATLSMDAVIALSYIFEGTLHDNLRKIVPLHAIIQNSTIQHEIGVVS
jgi:hypothetical protein